MTASRHLSREQILRTTAQCLRESGYDATTIRKIASMLSCAVGSIYRYFRDKRDLLYTVTQEQIEPVLAALDTGRSFEDSVRCYLEQVSTDTATYQLMFWLACAGSSEKDKSRAESARATDHDLPLVVRKIIARWGRVLSDQEVARRCWALVHGGLLLGETPDDILTVIRSAINGATLAQAPGPATRRPPESIPAVAIRPPVSVDASGESATPGSEDVCLL